MMRHNPYSVKSLISLTAIVLASVLAGCTTEGRKGALDDSGSGTLAIIRIEKTLQTSSNDCPVSVKILNRMQGAAWDGASYQVALLNKKNVAIGRLIGIPHQYTKSGYSLVDAGEVQGARCEDIVDVSLIYFGYYPTGGKEVHLHNNRVKAEIK
jgi:hypothetical protein